jgi:hypothetical protein
MRAIGARQSTGRNIAAVSRFDAAMALAKPGEPAKTAHPQRREMFALDPTWSRIAHLGTG